MSAEDAANAVNLTDHPDRKRECQEEGMNKRNEKKKEVSQSIGNADLISFSPSLAQILSFLDYKDVFHCKLVNHRFYDVIAIHRQKMSRPRLHLYIQKATTTDTNEEYIVISLYYNQELRLAVHIDSRHVNIHTGRSCALFNAFPGDIDGFGIGSREEGLRLVLESLCYHFDLFLRLPELLPTEWYPIISDTIKREGTRLLLLQTLEWPALATHLRNIVSIEIVWSTNVFNCLPRMSHMKAYLWLFDPTNLAAQDEILQMFTGWFSGHYRMPTIRLEEPDQPQWLYQVPPYLVALHGHNCHHRTVPFDEDDESFFHNELFIRRATDNVTLCIAYEETDSKIYIYDTVVGEREFESMRFDYPIIG